MLHLCLGRAGTGKSAAMLRAITEGRGVRQVLLIVPEQHSHDTERRLCAAAGNHASRYAEVLSFTRLANRVFSVTGGLAAPTLDAGGRILLMYTALKSVAQSLKMYQRPSRKPAFLTGLIATVDELKSCCVSPAHLWTAGVEADGPEGDKLRDLSLIYGAYEAMTARQGADPRDKLTRLAKALTESRWAAGMEVYIDGFTDFTPQERLVVRALLGQAETVTVALTCDGLDADGGESGVFTPALRTARQLLRLAKDAGVPQTSEVISEGGRVREPALAALEAHLFDPRPTPYRHATPELALFAACSPYSEAEWTAAEILRLVREEGYRFREITVAARSMDGWADLIDTAFTRYGVPVFVSRMSDILQKPIMALMTAALETAAGNYQYDDLFRYLKTGLTGLTAQECDLLENYALRWELRGSHWTQKADWTMHPRGYGQVLRPNDEALLCRLNDIRRRVTQPLERLRKHGDHTGRGQAVALYAILEEIGLADRLEERMSALHARGEPALAAEYGQLWDILCGGLEQCAHILGDAPMDQDEFAKLFSLVLSQYDVGTIPVSLDRVTAGDAPRLAHRACRALFLLGADDGAIPQASPAPGLLNDDDRSLLASYGLELAPCLTDKLYRENTIVYETCALPSAYFSVSWATAGPDGEARRPSFLVGKLRAQFPSLAPVYEAELDGTFRLAAPWPALERLGRFPQAGAALKMLPGFGARVERMERAAALTRGHLGRGTVDTLYGGRVPMSASRMDKYKACHFSYFMQYGLKAQPRTVAGFRAPEYGTFVHYVLQHVFQSEEYQALRIAPDSARLRALTRTVMDRYTATELGGLERETPRFQYLFRRLFTSICLVVENVAEELAASKFEPVAFELGFGERGDLPPVEFTADGLTVSVSGFVDRVDGWVKDGRLYLRVVDYKTGHKSFDLTDIWNGLGLQMLLYLFTLGKTGAARFQKEIVPAGVLYLPARDAVVAGSRSMSEAERQKKVDAELRRSGLILDAAMVLEAMEIPGAAGVRFLPVRVSAKTGEISGEALVSAVRLGKLEKHTRRILREITEELAAGNIAADPFWRGPERNACQWCEFAAACHFEEGRGGDTRRYLPTVKGDAFWRALEGEPEFP